MNTISRVITGLTIVALSLWLLLATGFINGQPNYVVLITGPFFLIVGLVILFNRKEDKIEQIKGSE